MASSNFVPDNVHLVGSIGYDHVEDVYQNAGRLLGRRLQRIPDGEPGPRGHWVFSQYPYLRVSPFLRQAEGLGAVIAPFLEVAPGVRRENIHFGELCYAREARSSYQDFRDARGRGELPSTARFQVSLPTPFAVVGMWIAEKDRAAVEPAYERAMLAEVEKICASIPHQDLCIQWDLCAEMLIWDGQPRFIYGDKLSQEEIIDRITRLSVAVPAEVELGFHLCYGDLDAKPAVEIRDAAKMVELSNAIFSRVDRPVTYIHMPVALDRFDAAFFAPFQHLKRAAGAQIFLGVVHAADGVDGANRRIAAASAYLSDFGIAAACGMSRSRTPELVTQLLTIHRDCSREPANASKSGPD
jgi:hypothetical protein